MSEEFTGHVPCDKCGKTHWKGADCQGPSSLAAATGYALAEKPNKRRNIWAWRESRLRRLEGMKSVRQKARIAQLEAQIKAHNTKPTEDAT